MIDKYVKHSNFSWTIFAERKHHANSMNYNYIDIYKYITV